MNLRIVGVIVGLVVIVYTIIWGVSAITHPSFKFQKTDTVRTWLKYFKQVGTVTLDTDSYVIRIIADTFKVTSIDSSNKNSIVTKRVWKRDSFYYIPHDTTAWIYNYDTVSHKKKDSTLQKVTQFILLPEGWQIYDYNKATKLLIQP